MKEQTEKTNVIDITTAIPAELKPNLPAETNQPNDVEKVKIEFDQTEASMISC